MYFINNNIQQQQHMYNNKTLQQVYVQAYTFYSEKTFKFMYNFLQFYLNNIPTYWHRDSLHSCHIALGFAHNPKMDACVQTQN